MCSTATIMSLVTDRPYRIEGGWRSYEEQMNADSKRRRVTLVETKDLSTREIIVTEESVTPVKKTGGEIITVIGTFVDGLSKHRRTLRITMNHARSDCMAIVAND
jgi:hypothetical protein